MAELVDALDSKSSSFGSVGSIPTRGTLIIRNILFNSWLRIFYFKFGNILTNQSYAELTNNLKDTLALIQRLKG